MQYYKLLPLYFWHMLKRFHRKGCIVRAAALAFNTTFFIVPFFIVSFSLIAHFPFYHQFFGVVENFIVHNFVATSADKILEALNHFLANAQNLSIMNMTVLFIVVLLTIYNTHVSFNEIWGGVDHRNLLVNFAVYIVIMIMTPILLTSIALFVTLLSASWLAKWFLQLGVLVSVAVYLAPTFLSFVFFTLINWILPSHRIQFRNAAIAGLVTAVLFQLAKIGFAFYLEWFQTYKLLYGALALFPLFLLWLYITWLIILFGGLVCHDLEILSRRKHRIFSHSG